MTTIEIRIKKMANGKRMAFYRQQGTTSMYWHQMPVRHAEKAIDVGMVSIGIIENAKAVAA